MKPSESGSASFGVFILFLFAALLVFFLFFINQPDKPRTQKASAGLSAREAELTKLEEEIYALYSALDGAEAMGSRAKYLEIVSVMQAKWLAVDALWDEEAKKRQGLADGLMGGFSENYDARFHKRDKLVMLSEKYGIAPEAVEKLKADIEIMFAGELATKFGVAAEAEGENPGGKDT